MVKKKGKQETNNLSTNLTEKSNFMKDQNKHKVHKNEEQIGDKVKLAKLDFPHGT